MNTAEFGFAEADITPGVSVTTIGFGRADEISRGVMRPLTAQVSVWKFEGECACLAAIDHIGFSRAHADEVRDAIGAILGAPRQRVMLCFSHTHAAPNDSVEAGWFESARSKILDAAARAAANLSPCLAAWGCGAADIGVNRRSDAGALDKRVGILKIVDAESYKTRLLLLRLTAHANVLKADNYLLSPDFIGAVREALAERYGCAVMVTQGASGNVAPRFFQSALTPPDVSDPTRFVRSETALQDMAREVLRAVEAVYDGMQPEEIGRFAMYSATLPLEATIPSIARAREIALEARTLAGIDGAAWLDEVQRLLDEGVSRQIEAVELQYFAVSDGCLCGVPNELMCEFALRASDRLKSDFFFLGGYVNGCTGYFPTEEEYDRGGYEVTWSMLHYFMYHGRVMPLDRDSAAALIDAAVRYAPGGLRKR